MTKTRKWTIVVLSFVTALLVGAYLGIPVITQSFIKSAIEDAKGVRVEQVSVRWGGPQLLTGLVVETDRGWVDLNVEIENDLFDLLVEEKPIKVLAKGDASIVLLEPVAEIDRTTSEKIVLPKRKEKDRFSIPKLEIEINLASITIEGDDSLVYHNVIVELDVDPSRHFVASLTCETDLDGKIEASFSAPALIDEFGELNPKASGSLGFTIENASIPTINGAAGWSITKLRCEISSPNISESISIGANGSLAEYNQQRGSVLIKTQLSKTEDDTSFTFGNWAVVGTVDISDVPTSILTPWLQVVHIDTARDIGPTMDLKISRVSENTPPLAIFNTREVKISGTVDPDNGLLSDVDIVSNLHSDFLQELTQGELSGNPVMKVHLDRLVPVGVSNDTLSGKLTLEGSIHSKYMNMEIEDLHASIQADVVDRTISTAGLALVNGQESVFECLLYSPNKNKLDGIDDLWKTITSKLPQGDGEIVLKNLSSSILTNLILDEKIVASRDIGKSFDVSAKLKWNHIDTTISSKAINGSATLAFEGDRIVKLQDVDLTAVVDKQLATEFAGTNIASTSTLHILSKTVDFDGNGTFDITLDIGKRHTVIVGKTTRGSEVGSAGNLDLHVSATGVDTHLLDAMCNFKGALVDSVGSPVRVNKLIVKNILSDPLISLDCESANAHFTSELEYKEEEGVISTYKKTPTKGTLDLTVELSNSVFKNFGPLLGDIVSVAKLVKVRIDQATASVNGDYSKLNGHIIIDIGKANIDSNSMTMQLLTMFNPKLGGSVPVFFDPIDIQIHNGIATYNNFKITIANKFQVLQTGTINLKTKELMITSVVPLTSLGYNIKKLRGLDEDIGVPLLIAGTIDNPIVRVEPSFDLGRLLLEIGVGEALDDVFGGNKEAPNPLDIIEDLLNDRN